MISLIWMLKGWTEQNSFPLTVAESIQGRKFSLKLDHPDAAYADLEVKN